MAFQGCAGGGGVHPTPSVGMCARGQGWAGSRPAMAPPLPSLMAWVCTSAGMVVVGDRARQGSRAEKLGKKRTDRTESPVSSSPGVRYDRYGQRDLGVLLRNVRYGRSRRLGYPELSHLPGVGPLGTIVDFF